MQPMTIGLDLAKHVFQVPQLPLMERCLSGASFAAPRSGTSLPSSRPASLGWKPAQAPITGPGNCSGWATGSA